MAREQYTRQVDLLVRTLPIEFAKIYCKTFAALPSSGSPVGGNNDTQILVRQGSRNDVFNRCLREIEQSNQRADLGFFVNSWLNRKLDVGFAKGGSKSLVTIPCCGLSISSCSASNTARACHY